MIAQADTCAKRSVTFKSIMQGLQKLLLDGQEPDAVFLSHKLEIKGDRPPARCAIYTHRISTHLPSTFLCADTRYGHGIVPVIVEGKAVLVLFGGIDKEGNYREEVDAFDTAKLQWTQLTNSLEVSHRFLMFLSSPSRLILHI